MSLFDTLSPHLPYLRRFSRALTGSQQEGDLYVRSALEALVEGDATINDKLAPKTALYRMFLGIWNSTGATLEDRPGGVDNPADRVRLLMPKPRQAFLLSALEGMDNAQIATIMDISEAEAASLLVTAEKDIEKELRTTVLIIEDEPIIAADIEGLVEDLGHTVDAIAATRAEAAIAVRKKIPGIVLADVHLADGSSGIDAVDDILSDHDVPVVFITAFPELLLTGDKPEPAYLISKPFSPSNVKAAISQALYFHNNG